MQGAAKGLLAGMPADSASSSVVGGNNMVAIWHGDKTVAK